MIETMVAFLKLDREVGSLVGSRIYPIGLPQEPTLPAVTYLVVDWPNGYDQVGRSHGEPRFQFDGYASTYGGARALGEALRGALERFGRGMGVGVFVDGPRDLGEPRELERWRVLVECVMMGVVEDR